MLNAHFDRAGVYHSLFVPKTVRNGIFSDDSLSGTGMGRDENAFISFDCVY